MKRWIVFSPSLVKHLLHVPSRGQLLCEALAQFSPFHPHPRGFGRRGGGCAKTRPGGDSALQPEKFISWGVFSVLFKLFHSVLIECDNATDTRMQNAERLESLDHPSSPL